MSKYKVGDIVDFALGGRCERLVEVVGFVTIGLNTHPLIVPLDGKVITILSSRQSPLDHTKTAYITVDKFLTYNKAYHREKRLNQLLDKPETVLT